ncbi:unnamed protein product [Parajaminaea phylloscopi]
MADAVPLAPAMALALPAETNPDALASIIRAHATTEVSSQGLDLARPDEAIILAAYSALLSLASKYDTAISSGQAREADAESQIHQADRARLEAEERLQETSRSKEALQTERDAACSELDQTRVELAALKSDVESGVAASSEMKSVLDKERRERREMLEVLDRERAESVTKTEQLDALRKQHKETLQENSRLHSEAQQLRSSESAARFKVQTLTQELELSRKDAEWCHSELSRLDEEHKALRKAKHTEIARLQAELDNVTQALTSLQTKSETLQVSFDDNTRRLNATVSEREELQAQIATQEETFRREMETKDRLTQLLERRAEDANRRVEQVEAAWENVLHECREREEELKAEIAQSARQIDVLTSEKNDLKAALDRLAESVGIDTSSASHSSHFAAPSTPSVRPFASSVGVGANASLAMSPTVAITSSLHRSGKTFTEVYTALAKTEEELRRERVETERLASVLDTVMSDLQERAPALQAQREETERLAAALEELSGDFARACEGRDVAEREQKKCSAESTALRRENQLLLQQLSDLGKQVRHLTREVMVRDDPAAASRLEDDHSDLPSLTETPDADLDTQGIITSQLVTFDSLTSLVAQNGRLLRVARELGARMEEEEAKWRERNNNAETQAIQEASQTIERLDSEIHSERAKAEGLRRERDMFRSMLASGSRHPATTTKSATDRDESADGQVHLASQYSALQGQFEAFREETSRDSAVLKEEARQARDEAGRSAIVAARERASREASDERLRLLQQSADLQRSEANELSKQMRAYQERAARLEASSQTSTEDLMSARKDLERLRYEMANLRAERDLAKSIEQRLVEENSHMVKERAGLNELLRNVQSMQNEIDRNARESKTRLESQVERLEEQVRQAQNRLDQEVAGRRELEMRKDVESGALQSRMDSVSTELAHARQQLAVAQTNVDHLTRKSDELQKQIQSREEKLSVYERGSGSSAAASSSAGGVEGLGSEQLLRIEVAELRGELRGLQIEAEQSKVHADRFRDIAQSSEETLTQLQATYEEYKSKMEASNSAKDAEITHLRARLDTIAAEVPSLQNEISSARQALETQRSEFAAEKRSLEDAIAELGTVEERAKNEQQGILEDIEKHAQVAREAQSKYESELVAHADNIRELATVKAELQKVRGEIGEAQKNAEMAQANLNSSATSWEAQRESLTKEKDAIQQRLTDSNEQNTILHEHMEKLSQQISELRQSKLDGSAIDAGNADASFSGAPADELQQVVRYLRDERDVANLQADLHKQEAARLRLSLESTIRALDEAKLRAAEEAERRSAAAGPGAKQHEELLDKINQLSILRESNITLRDERERANRKVALLQTQLAEAQAKVEPLRDDVRRTQGELEAAQGQIKIIQEDNQRWQARAQNILAQYDRVDPEEIKSLEQRASAAESRVSELQQQIDSARSELAGSKEQFAKLRSQATERIQTLRNEVAKLTAQVEALNKEKDELMAAQTQGAMTNTTAIEELQQRLSTAEEEKAASQQAVVDGEEKLQLLESQIVELKSQVEGAAAVVPTVDAQGTEGEDKSDAKQAVEEAQKAWQEEKAALEASRGQLEAREKQHHQKAREFLQGMRQAQKERDELRTERDEALAKVKESEENASATVAKAVEERLAAQQSDPSQPAQPTQTDSTALEAEGETLRARIAELETALQKANARIAELEASLAAGSSSSDGAGGADANAAIDKLKAQHAEEMKTQQTALSQQYQKRQSMAVEVAVKKAQAAAASSSAAANSDQVELQVQERLKAFETDRDGAQAAAIRAAVEAKEKELREALAAPAGQGDATQGASDDQMKARYEAGYTAGKNEASLRNQLLIKQKDGKIAKLTTELAELKGETIPPASPARTGPVAGANAAQGGTAGPGTPTGRGGSQAAGRGGRGGAQGGVGLPVRPPVGPAGAGQQQQQAQGATTGPQTSVRGRAVPRGASIRGVGGRGGLALRGGGAGRGGAHLAGIAGAGGQKRKASEDVSASAGVNSQAIAGAAAAGGHQQGGAGGAGGGGGSPGGAGAVKKAKGGE